jgi:hypothetical protein
MQHGSMCTQCTMIAHRMSDHPPVEIVVGIGEEVINGQAPVHVGCLGRTMKTSAHLSHRQTRPDHGMLPDNGTRALEHPDTSVRVRHMRVRRVSSLTNVAPAGKAIGGIQQEANQPVHARLHRRVSATEASAQGANTRAAGAAQVAALGTASDAASRSGTHTVSGRYPGAQWARDCGRRSATAAPRNDPAVSRHMHTWRHAHHDRDPVRVSGTHQHASVACGSKLQGPRVLGCARGGDADADAARQATGAHSTADRDTDLLGSKAIGLENRRQNLRRLLILVHGGIVRRVEPEGVCLSWCHDGGKHVETRQYSVEFTCLHVPTPE